MDIFDISPVISDVVVFGDSTIVGFVVFTGDIRLLMTEVGTDFDTFSDDIDNSVLSGGTVSLFCVVFGVITIVEFVVFGDSVPVDS